MIVCMCEAINDQTIRALVQAGCDTVPAVQRACGAGGQCGACTRDVRKLVAETRAQCERPQARSNAAK